MATKVQIWNRAARAAGETRQIASEDDLGVVVATLAEVHEDIVREALAAKEWPWARVQSALSAVSETRVGWEFVYTLPADCVRPLALLHEGERRELIPVSERLPFTVVPNDARDGYLLCTDDDEFEVLEYIPFIAEPTVYPPHFIEALVRRLAAHLLDAVKKAPDEALAMMKRYELALADAMVVALNSAGPKTKLESPGILARG